MPFCHVTLKRTKRPPEGYPEKPDPVGEHLRKMRMDRRLLQRDMAERLGVCKETIRNWELGYRKLALRCWPRVIDFLGFVLLKIGDSLGEGDPGVAEDPQGGPERAGRPTLAR